MSYSDELSIKKRFITSGLVSLPGNLTLNSDAAKNYKYMFCETSQWNTADDSHDVKM